MLEMAAVSCVMCEEYDKGLKSGELETVRENKRILYFIFES